jgi:hypothetical protein
MAAGLAAGSWASDRAQSLLESGPLLSSPSERVELELLHLYAK